MPDIVKRSGLSHGAVYVYFKSKDDIILALAVDRHRQEAVLNSVGGNSAIRWKRCARSIRAYAARSPTPSGDAPRRVGVNGWAEALRNERVRAAVLEGVTAPVAVSPRSSSARKRRDRSQRRFTRKRSGARSSRCFQGFTLQVAWGQAVDIEAAVAAIECMLFGLAPDGETNGKTKIPIAVG